MSQKCEQNEKTSENGSAGIALLSIMFDVAMRNDKSKTFSVVKDLLKSSSSSSSPKKSNDDDAVDDSTGDKSGDDCDDNDDSKGLSDRDAFKEKMVELLDTIREQNIDSDKKSSLLTSRLAIDDLNALSEYLSDLIERGARDVDGDDRLLSEDRKMVVVLLKLFSSFSPSSVFDEKKMSDLLAETTNARKAYSDDSSKTTTGGSKRGSATVPKKTGLFILRDGCRIRPSRLHKGDTMSKVKYEMDETTHRDNFDAHATVWRIKEYETVPDEEDRGLKLKTYNVCIEFLKAWIIVDQKQARPKLGIKFLTKTDCQRANLTFDKVAKDFIFDTFKKLDFIEWVPRRRNDDDDEDDRDGDSSMEVEKNDQQNVSDDRRSGSDNESTNDGDRSSKKSVEKDDDKEDDVEKKERIAKISDNIERLYRIFKRQTIYDVEKGFYLEGEDSEKIFELEEDDERSPSQIFFDTFSKLLPFVIKKDEKESAKRERLVKKGEDEDEDEDDDHSVYFGVMHQENENQKNAEKIPRLFYKSEDLYVPTSPAIADKRFSSEGFNNFFQPNCLYFKNKERFDEYVAKLTRCSLDVDTFNTFVLTSLASSSRAKKKTTIAPPSKKKSQKYDMPKMKKRGGRTSSSSSSSSSDDEDEKKVADKVRSKQKKATSSSSPDVAVKKSTKKKTVDADDSKKESDRKKTAKASSKSKKQESTKVEKKNTNVGGKKRAREDDEDASNDERVSKKRRSDSNANKKPQKKKTDKRKPSSSSSSEEEENKKKPTARASKKNGDDWDF